MKEAELQITSINNQLSELTKKKMNLENKIKINEELIAGLNRQFKEKYEVHLSGENIDKEIHNYKLVQEIERIEKEINRNYLEIGKILGDNTRKEYNFENLLISDIINEVALDLKEKKEKGIIPTKLDKSTFEYLINRVKLLCDECKEKMKSEQERVIDEELNEKAKIFLNEILKIQEHLSIVRNELQEKYGRHRELYNKHYELIKDNPKSELNADVFGEYLKLREEIDRLREENKSFQEKINKLEEELDELKKKK